MSDIYHIPHDDGKTYRLKKFVEYQHEVPATHYRFVGQYCRNEHLDKNQIVNMAFIMSATYSELTTVLIFELLKKYSYEELWANFAEKLNFGSARKHMKLKNRFICLANDWEYITQGKYYDFIKDFETDNEIQTYKRIQKAIMQLNEVGRFASELFLELIVYMQKELEIQVKQPTQLNWKDCANVTSGTLNIFYEDEKANEYDRTGKITDVEQSYLTIKLREIQKAIRETYPEQNSEITMFSDKICSFRNLFKGTRYGGFHHDRQLQVLREYEKQFPEYKYLWEHCYKIRREIYAHRLLGELNGWTGIRKERKKLWLTTGKTGVEL